MHQTPNWLKTKQHNIRQVNWQQPKSYLCPPMVSFYDIPGLVVGLVPVLTLEYLQLAKMNAVLLWDLWVVSFTRERMHGDGTRRNQHCHKQFLEGQCFAVHNQIIFGRECFKELGQKIFLIFSNIIYADIWSIIALYCYSWSMTFELPFKCLHVFLELLCRFVLTNPHVTLQVAGQIDCVEIKGLANCCMCIHYRYKQ